MADTTTTTYALVKPEINVSTTWPTSWNANADALDTELGKPRYPFNSPTVGATTTLDLSLARTFVFTVSQATTIAFSNVPTSSFTTRVVCLVTNGSAFALTWPASVLWLAGAGPTFRVSGVDVVELITRDGGTTWYASKMTAGGVIYSTGGLSTTSTSEVSLASVTTPANLLTTNGQELRVTVTGSEITQAGVMTVKWGAFNLITGAVASGAFWRVEIVIVRTGAATQFATVTDLRNAAAVSISRVSPDQTLSSALLLDFRGSVTAGGTFRYDTITVEFLGA